MSDTTSNSQEKSQYEHKYKADYESDWEIHRNYIQSFDSYEAMLIGVVYDSVSNRVDGSKITDSYATTLSRDRADRVIAKLPEGETQSVGRADVGKALFMDLLRQKWIYPNANAQRPFLEKLNLWQFYSSVYGYMLMFYDWTTSSTGYVGPDCWLWNPRNFIPQQGKVSIEDMDYCNALTWVSKKRLQNILDKKSENDGWDRAALQELVNRVDTKTSGNDTNQDTFVERNRVPAGSKKGICLATRYEAGPDGEWCTFAPENGFIEVRKLKNPHKNGRIPFVCKYGQPLFDSFYGLGDFQRAKPLQFARDGLTNFYFANLKRNLAPGIIVNANGVVKHTLDVTKANPVLMETIPNSIRPMPTNTAGLSTYQAAQSNLTGSLLSLYGTQNASIPGAEALNPSQGKSQRYSEPVLTPRGWTTMGELKVGDEVINNNGKPAKISEIHEQGVIDTYDVFFRDGSATNCSLDHLWTVHNRCTKKKETLSLKDMLDRTITFNDGSAHYSVDLSPAIHFEKRELPIDPYLLGLLLGDGGFTETENRVSFTNSKEHIIAAVKELLPTDSEIFSKGERFNEFRIKGSIVEILKNLGLKGHLAKDKFIPTDYLYSDIEDRQRLFQGLMDTDGHVQKANNQLMEYCTVSSKLADDFLELARGLGYSTKMSVGISSAMYKGERKTYGNKYRLFICGKTKKYIVGVEKSAPENSRCLYVDTPDHLYITTDYTITHNTPAAIADYTDKEATRDGAERRHLETAIEQLTDGFFSLVANIGTEDIPIDLFYDDIKEIVRSGSGDVMGLFNGKLKMDDTETAGTLTIKPSALKGVEYRFNINRDSTMKVNKEKQLQALERFVGNIGKFQNVFKDDPRIDIHAEKIAQAFASLADIKGGDEFVTFKEGPSPQEQQMQQQLQQLQQELQTAQQPQQRPVSESLSYKDAPEDIKRQIEQQAGLQPSQLFSPAATDQALKHSTIIANEQQNQNAQAQLIQGVHQNIAQNPSKNAALKDPYLASAADHVNNL